MKAIYKTGTAAYLFILLSIFNSCTKENEQSPLINSTHSSIRVNSGSNFMNAGICDYDVNETSLTSTGWTKIFDEQFTNLNNWNIWTGGAYNNELQLYQASNLLLNNGDLTIQSRLETKSGPTLPSDPTPKTFNYTSGRIESKTLFSASKTTPKVRMIARLKLPAGYGMWPAFWSYGDPWPTQGEIDILEARGDEPYTFYTNYFYGRAKNRIINFKASATITSSVSLQDCWHVLELIWAQNSLTYLLDGQIVDTKTGNYVSSLFGKKEKITLNLAVGGAFFPNLNPSLIQPGDFNIDYVKVFTSR